MPLPHPMPANPLDLFRLGQTLAANYTRSNFDFKYKVEWSQYIQFLIDKYPDLKLGDYLFNFGEVPLDTKQPFVIAPDASAVAKSAELQYGVTLNTKGLDLMLEHGAPLYLDRSKLASTHTEQYLYIPERIVCRDMPQFLRIIAPQLVLNKPMLLLCRNNTSQHINIVIFVKRIHGNEYVVLDSVGGVFPPPFVPPDPLVDQLLGPAPGAEKYAGSLISETLDTLLEFSARDAQPVKISYFSLKRQNDMLSCPLFVLRDIFALKTFDLFYYIDFVEKHHPKYVRRCTLPGAPESIHLQIIPEHPRFLTMMQSTTFFDSIFELADNKFFISTWVDADEFETNVKSGFVTHPATKRKANMRAQKDMLIIALRIIRYFLLQTPLTQSEPGSTLPTNLLYI